MGRVIAALDRFDREILRGRTHALLSPASLHCATVRGGVGLSTYAPECVLEVERRTLPGETPEQVAAELEQVVGEAGEAANAQVTVTLARSPMTCPPDAPIARAVRDAARAELGAEVAEIGVAYWMDAAIFSAAGIPTVDFGPAGAGAHETVEWVSLDSVTATARVLVRAARAFAD
jgi:acetylornithine deacetylase